MTSSNAAQIICRLPNSAIPATAAEASTRAPAASSRRLPDSADLSPQLGESAPKRILQIRADCFEGHLDIPQQTLLIRGVDRSIPVRDTTGPPGPRARATRGPSISPGEPEPPASRRRRKSFTLSDESTSGLTGLALGQRLTCMASCRAIPTAPLRGQRMWGALKGNDPRDFTLIGDVDGDLGGPDVDVAGKRTNDFQGNAALGEHRAERVPQRVRCAAILANAGGRSVLGDDVAHRARADRLRQRRLAGAKLTNSASVDAGGSSGVPAPQRLDRICVQRDGAVAALWSP